MNHLTGQRKEKEAEWLAGPLKMEVAPFLSAEIGKKEFSFQDGGRRERMGESYAKLRVKKRNRALGQEIADASSRAP